MTVKLCVCIQYHSLKGSKGWGGKGPHILVLHTAHTFLSTHVNYWNRSGLWNNYYMFISQFILDWCTSSRLIHNPSVTWLFSRISIWNTISGNISHDYYSNALSLWGWPRSIYVVLISYHLAWIQDWTDLYLKLANCPQSLHVQCVQIQAHLVHENGHRYEYHG